MAEIRPYIHCSPSILNWKDKIFKRFNGQEYHWWRNKSKPVIFFGLYRPSDFLKFWWHKGEKTVIWTGSDILAMGWHSRWLQKIKANHICENKVEQGVLETMLQQEIEVQPLFFGNPNEFKLSYKQSKTPEVFIHINRNAERESGFFTIERISKRLPYIKFHIYGKMSPRTTEHNIYFHGFVPEEQFNREIRQYHGALGLHHFCGFDDTVAKSVLMGQYPITKVNYPRIDSYKDEEELIKLLDGLKNKKEPNYKARNYYLEQLNLPIWN